MNHYQLLMIKQVSIDALALKGTIYVYTGNYDKAIEYYDNALDVNPTDENLHKMKQDLIKKGLWSPNI